MTRVEFLRELEECLKVECKSGKFLHFSIECQSLERYEDYLIQSHTLGRAWDLDQGRHIADLQIFVKAAVKKSEKRIGTGRRAFYSNQNIPEQIEQLKEMCAATSEEIWQYPAKPDSFSVDQKSFYKGFSIDFLSSMQRIRSDLVAAIEGEMKCSTPAGLKKEFNSAEIFLVKSKKQLILSNGFRGEQERSTIYTEVCFSADNGKNSEEFLITKMGAHPEQLDFKKMCSESFEYAAASLGTTLTPTGLYSVLIDAEIIGQLFIDAGSHLDAQNKYLNLPFVEKGTDWIAGFSGDFFALELDPTKDFSFSAKSFAMDGLAQTKRSLVLDGKVREHMVSGQMSQYLGLPATTVEGALVVTPAGELPSKEELIKKSDQVLEVLQFSALFSQPRDLTFSSEIRLARLHDSVAGTVKYVKGGNLSGQFYQNFKKVRWAGDQKLHNLNELSRNPTYSHSYHGPDWALISDVTVSS